MPNRSNPPDPPATDAVPVADVLDEARRLLRISRGAGLALRLLGGVAIALRVPAGETPLLPRAYKDIDLVVGRGVRREVEALMSGGGYRPNAEFNALNGHRRLLYYDDPHGRQVDIFVNAFVMCHEIPLEQRLHVDPTTLPLAELLLTKLQIVELNPKDQADIFTLLYHHELGDRDGELVNAARVGELCAHDWGLWRTTQLNIERSLAALPASELSMDAKDLLGDRLTRLAERIEATPKTRKWKLRARLGDRVRWYDEPEEVD